MSRLIAGVALILFGAGLLGLAGWSALHPVAHYALTLAPVEADQDSRGFGLAADAFQRVEITAPEQRRPIATGLVAREGERLTPLSWRNEVTDSILFADRPAADLQKVLAAIGEHAPADALVFAWWDFSRAIRLIAKRDAPLDDALARGLLLPASWTEAREAERARWGKGASPQSSERFTQFVDALLADEKQGVAALEKMAGGKQAYIVAHISDVWKAASLRPDRMPIAYRDFPSSGVSHGVIKSALQWLREQKIEGGYAAEPIDGATRLHYFLRKDDGNRLIAKLLPFSTSNPAQIDGLELVYQLKGYWIYRLKNGS